MEAMLGTIAAHSQRLKFAGFMGYEAQVPFMPEPDRAFSRSMQTYSGFVTRGAERFPQLFDGEVTFNSGGSKTYMRFDHSVIPNDVAAGSAVVRPSKLRNKF